MEVPEDLRRALEGALGGVRLKEAAIAVDRLIDRYREEREAPQPILASRVDIAAYAAYRMPATYAAARTSLEHLAALAPDFAPRRLVDMGGGTGAAAWAAADTFPGLSEVEVIDQVPLALEVGRRLAAQSSREPLRHAIWRTGHLDRLATIPSADLVAISYVLSELSPTDLESVIRRAAAAGQVVAVVEPGTPRGYRRILAARSVLIAHGMSIVAPCPHQKACPLPAGRDWCHFSARINRSSLHRQVKGAELGYEDERFSYVIASRAPLPRAAGRILRHPLRRKGMVTMQVCLPEEKIGQVVITKRDGERYRDAKDSGWGGEWPPTSP